MASSVEISIIAIFLSMSEASFDELSLLKEKGFTFSGAVNQKSAGANNDSEPLFRFTFFIPEWLKSNIFDISPEEDDTERKWGGAAAFTESKTTVVRLLDLVALSGPSSMETYKAVIILL